MNQCDKKNPKGELVTRTLAMPADTNPNGDIFGGWLVSQMDLGGAVFAGQSTHQRVVTVSIDSMAFLYPVHVGDVVSCYASLQRTGTTSIAVNIEAWVTRDKDSTTFCATEGLFTYVAVNKAGRPTSIK